MFCDVFSVDFKEKNRQEGVAEILKLDKKKYVLITISNRDIYS